MIEIVDKDYAKVKSLRRFFLKIVKADISIISVDKIFTQIFNALYFIVIARLITTDEFGIYTWCISISSIISLTLTLGINPVVTRKVAQKEENTSAIRNYLSIYFNLVFLIGNILFFIYLLSLGKVLNLKYFFLSLAILQGLLSNINIPHSQILLGQQKYKKYAMGDLILIITKVIIGLVGILIYKNLIILFIALIISNIITFFYYIKISKESWKNFILPQSEWSKFRDTIKDSLPLLGMLIFNSTLARFDWILLGILDSNKATAEYSLAYRVYEVSWLPHVILTTILFPIVCKIFTQFQEKDTIKITNWFKGLLYVSFFLPVVICLFWSPVIGFLTHYKYGSTNQNIINILAIGVPLAAGTSYFYYIGIAKGQNKIIFYITVSVTIFNILVNIIFIKLWGNTGASITAVVTNFIQFLLYLFLIPGKSIYKPLISFLLFYFLFFLLFDVVINYTGINFINKFVFVLLITISGLIWLNKNKNTLFLYAIN